MAIQQWSDHITLVELADDPQFSEELANLADRLEDRPTEVVLNFAAVGFLNSTNISHLLRLRKRLLAEGRRLILCDVNMQVWGLFQVTGLDKVFDFTNDVSTALTTLRLADEQG